MRCKVDLHIHSLLSPCADLDMSPQFILDRSSELGLDIIGITDHNSTRQAPLVREMGEEIGICVLMGCELTSLEETHCLAFFEEEFQRKAFQEWLDSVLPQIPNNADKFGYQVVVNRQEEIVYEEKYLLWSALPLGIEALYERVKMYNGLFIPAHIDKASSSLSSQLGFVPPNIKADALELSRFVSTENFIKKNAYLKRYTFIHSSDAHCLDSIGEVYSEMELETTSFKELEMALQNKSGREVL